MQYLAHIIWNPKRYVWRAKGENNLDKIQRTTLYPAHIRNLFQFPLTMTTWP
jgi:hypothetical protein